MDKHGKDLAPLFQEVQMVETEIVRAIRDLHALGWGTKRIARELGIARNTVKRYLNQGTAAETQVRPNARKLSAEQRKTAIELYTGPAEGNAVVVQDLLRKEGVTASIRTIQRTVASRKRELLAEQAATVRFETAPGDQMQVDFGQRLVRIGGRPVKVYFFVAVLGYSRRISVKAFLSERQDDWREGMALALQQFGGVPRTILVDNARALVLERDSEANTVRFHPAFLQFCADWDVTPKACRPYRARTKGKVESGIKYVKRNALAGREFASFAELEAHLAQWQDEADQRIHGTTHEKPIDRFLRDEQAALRPLPLRAIPVRRQRLIRMVSHDAFVEVNTVRYSVPYQLVREKLEVLLGDSTVLIFFGGKPIAEHRRSHEPHAVVVDPSHHAGLWRSTWSVLASEDTPSALNALGRSLDDYAALIQEVAG